MNGYRWLRRRRGVTLPTGPAGRQLLHKLNHVGWKLRRPIRITSGKRTPHAQWVAYMDFLRGGILAAPCCSQHWPHPWSRCFRQCASNHCISRAVDCVILSSSGDWVNIGEDQAARDVMHHVGLCLPVGQGETWHVEVGDVWRS